MKKFEFTGETKTLHNGVILKRIRSLIEFHTPYCRVNIGELGGWIEKENNLSQGDASWIFDDAEIFGNARIGGNAIIFDDAMIFGNARIGGNAIIGGNAMIFGNAEIFGNAKIGGDAMIFNNAEIGGNAMIFNNARIGGNAQIFGNAEIGGNAMIERSEHYLSVGPIGSRNDFTTFFRDKDGEITVKCGCFLGKIHEFGRKVVETHKDSKHAQVYIASMLVAMAQIEDIAGNDMLNLMRKRTYSNE